MGQDYSDKPPSSTDKPVSGHPALRVGTKRDGESLPSGLLVRQTFLGGAAHFDNVSKAFASLTTAAFLGRKGRIAHLKKQRKACPHACVRRLKRDLVRKSAPGNPGGGRSGAPTIRYR
jgi:hypothetical protein